MNSYKLAQSVQERALSIGGTNLDGKQFETFDIGLLRVGDGDLNDHVDCQASGQLYYGMLTRKALENMRQAKTIYDNWYSTVYDECNELLRAETGIKRPNKVDVENRVRQDYDSKLERYTAELQRKEFIYERLNLFYSAWITKGFSLSDLTSRASKKINRDARAVIGGHSKGR